MELLFAVALAAFGFALLYIKSPRTGNLSNARPLGVIAIVVAALIVLYKSLVIIPAGHVGVVDLFGRVKSMTLKPGINLVNPLARVVKMSVKTQEFKEEASVPSQEGLTISLEVSILYHLDPEKASEVYKSVGPSYQEIILIPQFRSVIREVTASYEAKALYTSMREKLATGIKEGLSSLVAPRGIVIETTPLRNISLPSKVAEAIEEKLKAEQESQRMQFVLEKERLEADRKRIEAQGITDFQKIVSQGLSDQLLRWKGIEATEKLANSGNSKFVIIGGKDGLPVILNPDK